MSSETNLTFQQLALAAPILQAVEEIGYETPSAIQAQAIPPLLEGRDLLGQAQTGTGKTAAFALPLLSRIDLTQKFPQLLVLTPTRELAIQVAEALQTYARHLPDFHVLPVYGGQGMSLQLRQLKRGVHVVVGTPGRIQDHLDRGTLQLNGLKAVVLDEADEMLRMGFIDDVNAILEHTPADRQVALFSATMPPQIAKVARTHLKDPVEIKIATKTSTVETITQRYWQVRGIHKLDALTRMLEVENFSAIIIFVRTKTSTLDLAEKLEARGFAAAALNGDMNQAQREMTVDRLRNGGLDIVIATDVAARGLDVERISHVINYDIPTDTEAYVHRIGRTGRAGREGQAILFVSPRERRLLAAIEKATRQKITEMTLPTHAEVQDKRVGRFKETVLAAIESEELESFEEIVAELQAETDIGLSEIAAALAFLAQRDRPLSGFEDAKTAPTEDAGKPARKEFVERAPEEGMRSYWVDVGRRNGLKPGNIVGAIANEANLEAKQIGHIKIQDFWSFVDLPDDLDQEVIDHLSTVWVCGRELAIKPADEVDLNALPKQKPRTDRGDRADRGDRGDRGGRPERTERPKRDRQQSRGQGDQGGPNRGGGNPGKSRGRNRPPQQGGDVPAPGNEAVSFNDDNFGNSWDYSQPQQQRRTGGGGAGGRKAGGRSSGAGQNQQPRARGRNKGAPRDDGHGAKEPWGNNPASGYAQPYVADYKNGGGYAPTSNHQPTLATKGRSKPIDPEQTSGEAPLKRDRSRTPGKLSVSTKRRDTDE
ncbi:MAG: DEAD/DEAH box helicase [Zoogloeaceae bacterium]|nr:DEAD/DEAH box helicase [Gammaproteobacteria bacterium]MCP5230878.1 DEAD/DEAH box helicase [Zoogloeaceae bacterium]